MGWLHDEYYSRAPYSRRFFEIDDDGRYTGRQKVVKRSILGFAETISDGMFEGMSSTRYVTDAALIMQYNLVPWKKDSGETKDLMNEDF